MLIGGGGGGSRGNFFFGLVNSRLLQRKNTFSCHVIMPYWVKSCSAFQGVHSAQAEETRKIPPPAGWNECVQ